MTRPEPPGRDPFPPARGGGGPGGPAARAGGVPWSAGDVVRATALALAVIFAVGAIAALVASARHEEGELRLPGGLWLLALQTAVLAGAAWLFSVRKHGGGLAALGFRRPAGRYPYLLAAGAWIGALTLAAAWSLLVAWTGPEWLHLPDSAGRLTAQFGRNTAGLLIVVVVWGPLGEEVFFRGFLLPGIAGRLGAPAAVVISSALFAGFHVDPGAFAPTLLLGAALAWIYLRTGSIWPGVVAHGAQNALALWLAGAS